MTLQADGCSETQDVVSVKITAMTGQAHLVVAGP